MGFYGNSNQTLRKDSRKLLRLIQDSIVGVCFYTGDVNEIMKNNEKRGGKDCGWATMERFRSCVDYCGLIDFDVYAFGALLLEVACGRKPIESNAPPEELVFVDWVWDNYKAGRVLNVIDKRLNDQYDVVEAMMVVRYLEGEVMVPRELRAPDDELEGKKYHMGIGGHDGFDDFLHSFPSSSFDNLSGSYSFKGNNNNSHRDGMDQSFASLSTSLSLLQHGGGDTTRLSE
ncbi:hypothetical protein F8388_011029 [Cannabis sativa]|uniref:Serine-threonine/tyrosine-protein kinase catalytic domain-containing protein n=1 Tax=Cannabis sativa TaxID=3483 RepID=A0A7J6FQU4_CANSA|nr:hypothetical protein F8388_011029 [Cannabis sativa]